MSENTEHLFVESTEGDRKISLLDLAIVLAVHKRAVIGLPVTAALVAAVVSFLMTPIYTGTTRILPPQQSQSIAPALLTQIDNLGGLAAGIPGLRNPNELYVGMIKS